MFIYLGLMLRAEERERYGVLAGLRFDRALMLRLLVAIPPGRLRFTIIDSAGLGENFAAFMHLADHDPALIGHRIWTEPAQIEQRLADLTEHMETVIQKYLRDEFATLEDYNPDKGEKKIQGSFRHALRSAEGPRTIVFDVSGAIALKAPLEVRKSNLTIAGQTSPGGLTVWGYSTEISGVKNVIVRYLRFRPTRN